MEFRRAEIKRFYRHIERITSDEEVRAVFQALYSNNLTFSMRINGVGSVRSECSVLKVHDEMVDVLSRYPSKCKHSSLSFGEIEFVEVVCNREIVAEENDNGGRWARII